MRQRQTRTKKEIGDAIGRKLRATRQSRTLTLRELSEASTVSIPDLSQYERGLILPRLDTLEKIADALDTPIVDLVA